MSKFNLLLYQKRVMMIIASDNLQNLGILFLLIFFSSFWSKAVSKIIHHLEKNQKFEITELYYYEYKYKCLTLAFRNIYTICYKS